MEERLYILRNALNALSLTTREDEDLIKDDVRNSCQNESCNKESVENFRRCDETKQNGLSMSSMFILKKPTFHKMCSESTLDDNRWTCKKLLGGGFCLRGFEPLFKEGVCDRNVENSKCFDFECKEGEGMIFLYPDLRTAIIGKFQSERLTLIKGKEAYVGISFCKNQDNESILVLRLHLNQNKTFDGCKDPSSSSITKNEAVDVLLVEIQNNIIANEEAFVYFDAPNSKCSSKYPLHPDALERNQVYVATAKESENSIFTEDLGEGLFMKQEVLNKGAILSYFNGVRKKKTFTSFQGHEGDDSNEFSGYSINVGPDLSLDIPKSDQSTSNYCATLGHKACHAFKENANTEFRPTFHPRFGLIIGLFSKRPIPKNEEILVDYQYSSIQLAPLWYKQAWKKYLKETRKWPKEFVDEYGCASHDVYDIFLRTERKFS